MVSQEGQVIVDTEFASQRRLWPLSMSLAIPPSIGSTVDLSKKSGSFVDKCHLTTSRLRLLATRIKFFCT